jgi:biopolymer transport protein ExbD
MPTRRVRVSHSSAMALNIAPMIDVTFLLLIFFLVTTTFKRPEGIFSAQMPKDAGSPSAMLPVSPIVVRVGQFGPSEDDYSVKIDNFTRTPQTFTDLARFLADIQENPGFDKETPVVIAPTPDVRWDHVVNCWNAAVRAKCRKITFAGRE